MQQRKNVKICRLRQKPVGVVMPTHFDASFLGSDHGSRIQTQHRVTRNPVWIERAQWQHLRKRKGSLAPICDTSAFDDGLSRDIQHLLKINETDASKVTVTKAAVQINDNLGSLGEAPAIASDATSQAQVSLGRSFFRRRFRSQCSCSSQP